MLRIMVSVVVLVSVFVPCTHAYGWWIDQPYDDLGEYNTNAEYLTNATLSCSTDASNNDYRFLYWIMPNMFLAEAGYNSWFPTVKDGPAGWQVDNQGLMAIINVHEEHFGFYTCLIDKNGTHYAIKRSLNADGAYFADLWSKYKRQTVIAFGASGIFLALVTSLCLLYNYKVYGPEQRKKEAEEAMGGNSSPVSSTPVEVGVKEENISGHENPGFLEDREEAMTSL